MNIANPFVTNFGRGRDRWCVSSRRIATAFHRDYMRRYVELELRRQELASITLLSNFLLCAG